MNINQALRLGFGHKVACPADRGSAAYIGEVRHVSGTVNRTPGGVEYIWVTVRNNYARESVWPSNRLGVV